MSGKLQGKVAIVTGASKGIGAAIAKNLAAEGAAVAVNYSSSREGAERTVKEIERNGGKAVAVQANVAKKDEIKRLFAETKKAFGRLDVLVNNAGIYEFVPLADITPEHFHKVFDLNVLGLLLASQEAVKHFGPDGGSIVNISSVVSSYGVPNGSVYSATKAAVDGPWPRSWGRARFALTPSIPAWWRPKASMRPALPKATCEAKPKSKRLWAASASRRTSRLPRSIWHQTTRPG